MISVCLASYNGEKYIAEQIESILPQLSSHDELIISDDGSTDNTIAIIQSFSDDRIKIVGNESHRLGVIKNFEQALMHANGDIIFLSDQDDIWLENKVKESIMALKNNLLIVSDCHVVDTNLVQTAPSFFRSRGSKSGILNNIIKNSYLGCCMTFKRELLSYALPIPKGAAMHDIWLGLIAESRGNVHFLSKPLILFRRHSQNASFTSGKSQYSLLVKVKNRVILSSLLVMRLVKNLLI